MADQSAVSSGQSGCAARTQAGEPCGMPPMRGGAYCWNHDPTQARERAAARKLGGYNRRAPRARDAGAEPPALRSADDVLREAEEALADVKLLENTARRATAIVSVLTLALRGLEAGELEQRLEAVERLMAERADHRRAAWRATASA